MAELAMRYLPPLPSSTDANLKDAYSRINEALVHVQERVKLTNQDVNKNTKDIKNSTSAAAITTIQTDITNLEANRFLNPQVVTFSAGNGSSSNGTALSHSKGAGAYVIFAGFTGILTNSTYVATHSLNSGSFSICFNCSIGGTFYFLVY